MDDNRPNHHEAKRQREIEAGRARLALRQTVQSPAPATAPAPVITDVTPQLNIPGVLDYEVAAATVPSFQTVVEDAPPVVVEPVVEATVAPEPVIDEPTLWTEETLHDVAKQGIAALRAIATPMGVVGRGKEELIREILAAQAEPKNIEEAEAMLDAATAPEATVSDDDIDALLND